MQHIEIIQNLEIIQARLNSALPERVRPYIQEHSLKERRGVLVTGPRGVGKTTLLLLESIQNNILYVSADNPLVANVTLTEIAEAAFAKGYGGIIFDEVHYAKDWSLHVKSIYDSYPGKKIWISDSSSLILRTGIADLSRRFPKFNVPFLSFREFLFLSRDISIKAFDPFNSSITSFNEVLKNSDLLRDFYLYKEYGFRPFFVEGNYHEKLLNIIEKSIFSDVPFFMSQIKENHLRLMNSIIGHIATANIPTINIETLANRWALGKDKVYEILYVMEHLELLHIVRFKSDKKAVSKGAKIFLGDPSMYHVLSGQIGNQREAIVTTIFRQIGKEIYACKDERLGDFETSDITLEIGGKDKKLKGADFVIRDDIESPARKVLPLWSLCMMY